MPTYEYSCQCGKDFEVILPIKLHAEPQECACGKVATKVFRTAPIGFVSPDICYDSPIDGRVIRSKQQRIEDLARSNCVPYEPGQKQDYLRSIEEADAALDKSIEAHVEQEIAKMPAAKKEILANELASSDIAYSRDTA